MTAADTSVIVPALVEWHVHHRTALAAVGGTFVPGHAYLESYSVLTRMPGGVANIVASDALARRYPPEQVLGLGDLTYDQVVQRCSERGVDGGSIYDGIIAMTALEHGHSLMTRDRRAARTYETLGVDPVWVGS